MKQRVTRIFSHLDEEPDAIVIMNGAVADATFFYVTGYRNGLFEQSAAILYPDGSREVICPELEATAAGPDAHIYHGREEKRALFEELLAADTIGVNAPSISHRDATWLHEICSDASLVDISSAIRQARMVKDAGELRVIRQACIIAADVARELPAWLDDTVTESQVLAEIQYALGQRGATPSFPPIVAFGEHSALPHYTTGQAARAWPALVDFGARCHRYCSDITRTFVDGAEQEAVYETVRRGQQLALDMMRPGVEARDVHMAVDDFFTGAGYPSLPHGLGHSLGLEVHDGMSMGRESDVVLEEGMVVTVEPGIYLPGRWGIRIEDDVLVTRDGVDVLTGEGHAPFSPKSL
ncbi:MAG: Xaa-Pro peptidase family protein [Thermoplasmatota archaeon]